ncbi:MotA/TolQ/ExbB proton channel family protein [Vibrio sp. MA40-2]|uniref:MotA/TolQ/ExbB proton channel family protein n=1 Tax=Vibrio sp. MA40-2 TaxID=3391828 RepID=UPI0039A578E1
MMFNKFMSSLLVSILFTMTCQAENSVLQVTKEAKKQALIDNKARETSFITKQQQLTELRDKLTAQRDSLQAAIDESTVRFSDNEQLLADKEKQLHLESGSLGELFGVVRQEAKALQVSLQDSVLSIDESKVLADVDAIIQAKTLPSKHQLYSFWSAFVDHINNGSTISSVDVDAVKDDGRLENKTVLRIGAFGLVDETGYLMWSEGHGVRPYLVQPPLAPTSDTFSNASIAPNVISVDPTAGQLLDQLALTPTIWQRVEQGGVIGQVILGLLVVGLLIGLVQGGFLFVNRYKINAQLKDKQTIGNNALGRILGVYKYDESPNVEALELRLYETILDEQLKLDRGLSMLKLLAALAPMLGLLGTVTGMIETFQVITQYGNADPRMMASGISTALVTTVLGLVSAMPLLFIHNVLTSQAESVRSLLEKQGIGLVAERAEQQLELA